MNILQWIGDNEKWLSVCVSFAGVLITFILTLKIISQTRKLNRQQLQLEEKLNAGQIEIQNRLIQVESLPYKREIYNYVFSVLELCHQLKELIKTVDLYAKEPDELLGLFQVLQEQYVPDIKKALWSMREAMYVLPADISAIIIDIRDNFDALCAHFLVPASIAKVLSPYEARTQMKKIKEHHINEAIACCNKIANQTAFIEDHMPAELTISTLK